jgi:hypothetical protein
MDANTRAKGQILRQSASRDFVPQGMPDIVNLLDSKICCFCGGAVLRRRQMWKFPDGSYMCVPCKTRLDSEGTKVK